MKITERQFRKRRCFKRQCFKRQSYKTGRFLALLVLIFTGPVVLAGEESDARSWLNKMARALHEQDYQGIFTYVRGSDFNTMQIVHKFREGEERERLLQLNDEKLEITRVDEEVICRHENTDHVDLGHHVSLGPFSSAFNENLVAYQDFYRAKLHGEGRIAGRPAVKLAISPKNSDRYGYLLWLDKETGLLLQSHMIDVDRKRVREIFQFSTIEIGPSTEFSSLESSMAEDAIQHRLSGEVVAYSEDSRVKPRWRVAWLPNGFRSVPVQGSDRFHFTDGLATFSVFVEAAEKLKLPDSATRVGGTVVITRSLKQRNGQITVVGEVPFSIAQRIADSVEPVIY